MSKRMNGKSETREATPIVKLVSMTSNPVGTLFAVWHNSRNSKSVDPVDIQILYDSDFDFYNATIEDFDMLDRDDRDELAELARYLCETYPEYLDEDKTDYKRVITQLVKLVIKCDVPASEFVHLAFSVDDANVAWREQLVRARKLSIWMQTSRTADLTCFDANRSHSIELFGGKKAVDLYDHAMDMLRDVQRKLVEMGVPSEDIRIIPQAMLHRVMFACDLRNLLKLIDKRMSWIAQSSLWLPIISGILRILRNEFTPGIIDEFIGKCEDITYHKNDDGEVIIDDYKYINESEDRYYGKDPQPTDPLHLAFKKLYMPEHTDLQFYDFMKSMYINIWNDDILSVLGWDRNDPSKIGPYDRPYSWFKNNDKLSIVEGLRLS